MYPSQYGFRTNHSTNFALMEVMDTGSQLPLEKSVPSDFLWMDIYEMCMVSHEVHGFSRLKTCCEEKSSCFRHNVGNFATKSW